MTSGGHISVVMIGCGKFSRYYHVPTLKADPGITFGGIFDPLPSDDVRDLTDRTGATLVAKLEALPAPACRTMALVTTPHALHAEHVAFALQRDWHVLCDKPFVMRTSEARVAGGGGRAARARQCGCLQPPLRPRLPAGTRHHPGGRHWVRSLRGDSAARLRGQGLVPGACARRRRAIHGSGNPHGRHRALADRAPADPRARPRARRQQLACRPRRLHRSAVRRPRMPHDLHRGRLAHVGRNPHLRRRWDDRAAPPAEVPDRLGAHREDPARRDAGAARGRPDARRLPRQTSSLPCETALPLPAHLRPRLSRPRSSSRLLHPPARTDVGSILADVMPGTAIALETAEGTPSVKVFEPSRADRKGGVIFYMGAFGLRPELDASRRH